MDLKRTKRIETISGIIVVACVLVIASIEMNPIIKSLLIISLCLGYLFGVVYNRWLKAPDDWKEK